jgi:hypothetical protein
LFLVVAWALAETIGKHRCPDAARMLGSLDENRKRVPRGDYPRGCPIQFQNAVHPDEAAVEARDASRFDPLGRLRIPAADRHDAGDRDERRRMRSCSIGLTQTGQRSAPLASSAAITASMSSRPSMPQFLKPWHRSGRRRHSEADKDALCATASTTRRSDRSDAASLEGAASVPDEVPQTGLRLGEQRQVTNAALQRRKQMKAWACPRVSCSGLSRYEPRSVGRRTSARTIALHGKQQRDVRPGSGQRVPESASDPACSISSATAAAAAPERPLGTRGASPPRFASQRRR